MKTLLFVALFVSMNAYAQENDKGIFFMIGEKIMSFGGHSYLELEKRMAVSEKDLANCLTDSAQKKFELTKKDEELLACKNGPTPNAVMATEGAPATNP